MPYLVDALTAARAEQSLRQHVDATVRVGAARLVRHKPGRRFLIEYDIILGGDVRKTWIGKSRAKGLDRHTFELQRTLHACVFAEDGPDGICVPNTVGVIPEWHMWLQEKVAGDPLTTHLGTAAAPALCARAIDAVDKLHKANVTARKAHGVGDELRILGERLPLVAEAQPELAQPIHDLLARCRVWAARLPPTTTVGIHRDFYPDQIIVCGSRLCLIDFDLYCRGDPALDVGNFLAHLTEMALRGAGDVATLTRSEAAALDSFIRLNPTIAADVVEVWKKLALARHVYISTQFPDRQPFTRTILEALSRDGCSLDVPHQ